MVLEHWDDGHWHRIGAISLAAGIRFIKRCRHPQPWRLHGDGNVWKIQAWNGRAIRFRETAAHTISTQSNTKESSYATR